MFLCAVGHAAAAGACAKTLQRLAYEVTSRAARRGPLVDSHQPFPELGVLLSTTVVRWDTGTSYCGSEANAKH